MIQFRSLKLSLLIDIHSDFTGHYAEMITADFNKEEVESCKNTIQLLQQVIDYRNTTEAN